MEEEDLEFRITPSDGEVPLLQHLLYPANSVGLPSHCTVLPCRPDTPAPEHTQPIPTDMGRYTWQGLIF